MDTAFLVDLLRKDAAALETVHRLESEGGVLWVPAAAVFELAEGIEPPDHPEGERRKVEALLDAYTFLPFDLQQAMRAGKLSGARIRQGRMLDLLDAQTAGAALQTDQAVLTRNRRHFEDFEGLQVVGY